MCDALGQGKAGKAQHKQQQKPKLIAGLFQLGEL